MEVNRQGSKIVMILDKEEDAVGLFAVLANQQASVTPEVFEHGKWLYSWFFKSVNLLAANYGAESSASTMSGETMSGPKFVPKKSKKR